jgi:AraC-like DNA-binding protein
MVHYSQNQNHLNPKQPEFVLATSSYTKKYFMNYNIAHFYQFTAESDSMGVIPDACIDILFLRKNGKISTRIAGTRFEKGEAFTERDGEYFGVRFMPGFNPVSNRIKISELVDHEEIFEDMITLTDEKEQLLENMFHALTFEDKINVFMNFYRSVCREAVEDKNSLKSFLRTELLKSSGDIKLCDLSIITGYSERYLNKRIHEDFGMNPKSLIRFIRFQKSVDNLIRTINDVHCINTALESGYYDQSHFYKEFKLLAGLTPSLYVEKLLSQSYDKKLHILH